MYRLLVADDEEWIRKGITETIAWSDYEVAVVGTAADAVDAMEKVRQYHPDLIITDIVMPGPTGVELLGWIRQELPDSKVIMISGHDQFQYAREALRKGAFDYLLKPVEETVLLETVRAAIDALQRERRKEARADRYMTSLEGLKQLFYMKLFDGKPYDYLPDGDERQFLQLELSKEADYACGIWCFGEGDETRLEMIRGLIERAAGQRYPELNVDSIIMQNQIVVLAEGQGDLQDMLCRLFRSLDSIALLIPDCGCCISRTGRGLSGLKQAITEADGIIANQFRMRGVMLVQEMAAHQRQGLEVCRESIRTFLEQLQLEDELQMRECSQQLIMGILTLVPGIGKAELGSILFHVMTDAAGRCQQDGIATQMPVTEHNEAVAWVFHLDDVSQALAGMLQFLGYLHDHIVCRDQTDRSYLIEKSLDYVRDNFSQDISADEMSEYLHISKAYFSQLFSREMGCPFTKYLTKYRIDYARKRLERTTDRIYEIAEASGYSDVKYFLKVFKKITGVSPQVYREHKNN